MKVTFFARKDPAFNYFNGFSRANSIGSTFSVMSDEGIFAMKSYVIHQRVRSRDIFDLFKFVEKGRNVSEILEYGLKADPSASVEMAKAVLRGVIPLDKEDEGLSAIGETITMPEIYDFFKQKINQLEIEIAAKIICQINEIKESQQSQAKP